MLAENSIFCGGIAPFRRLDKRAYVDTLAFAMYRREVYDSVGEYNENLSRTEDNEMHYRIREAGYKFCFIPQIESSRFTRNSFKKLLNQKFGNGVWIGATLKVCPKCFSIYHLVPGCFVLAIILTTLLLILGHPLFAILMWSMYFIADIGVSLFEMSRTQFLVTNLLLPLIFFLLHFVYGLGTLKGLIFE